MNGRKRNDYYKRESEKSKGNSDRRELRPPDTSTLISLLTLLNSISPPTLNSPQFPTTHSTLNNTLSTIRPTFLSTLTRSSLCTIHTTHNITTNRLVFLDCSSLSTDSFLEEEQITPFASTFGRSPFRNDNSSGTCDSSVTFNIVIVIYSLDVVNTI